MGKKAENGIAFRFPGGQATSFDPIAFDEAIRFHGTRLIHFRGMKCPVGLVDQYDIRRPHEDHSGCSNGYIYTEAGAVTCLFTGNTEEYRDNDMGFIDGSSVQVTSPRFYDDSDVEMEVLPFDRFYCADEAITVPNWQLVESSESGTDKLNFPATSVIDVMDANGKRYGAGDYVLSNGMVVWMGDRPGYDAGADRGVVYSIRYRYRPFWYCHRLIHQLRIAQVETPLERITIRMPQYFVLQRENVFENEERDDQAPEPDSARQMPVPKERKSFGPR